MRDGGVVYQDGDPYLSNFGILTVRVSRNIQQPYFQPASYTFRVKEDDAVGEDIGQVTLVDPDLNVRNIGYLNLGPVV